MADLPSPYRTHAIGMRTVCCAWEHWFSSSEGKSTTRSRHGRELDVLDHRKGRRKGTQKSLFLTYMGRLFGSIKCTLNCQFSANFGLAKTLPTKKLFDRRKVVVVFTIMATFHPFRVAHAPFGYSGKVICGLRDKTVNETDDKLPRW